MDSVPWINLRAVSPPRHGVRRPLAHPAGSVKLPFDCFSGHAATALPHTGQRAASNTAQEPTPGGQPAPLTKLISEVDRVPRPTFYMGLCPIPLRRQRHVVPPAIEVRTVKLTVREKGHQEPQKVGTSTISSGGKRTHHHGLRKGLAAGPVAVPLLPILEALGDVFGEVPGQLTYAALALTYRP